MMSIILFCACALLTLDSIAGEHQPNLIFIVADDLGWNDVGWHNPDILSPNLDHLAMSGIILNQSYVQPLCSPSRSAFMTGYYPFRMGLQHLVIGEQQDVCVPLDKTFFPQVLKKNGYKTHMVGKWHLGFCKWECTPTYRGFDSFYGFYSGGEDYYTKNYPNGFDFRFNQTVEKAAEGNYSTLQFAQRVDDIIEDHNTSQPLYLYLPFQAVHMPLQVPQEYLVRYPNITNKNRKAFSGMVSAMDDAVGRLVDALKSKDMYNNTIIVFTADNGGWTVFGGNNYPLRGGKVSIFEGGTRAAAFVHSPLLEKKGSVFNGMMHAVDWFPTLVEAVGIVYNDTDQDGVSQWKPITTLGASNRNEIVYNMDFHPQPLEGSAAIRFGDYKLIEGYPGLYQNWYKPNGINQGFQININNLVNMNQFNMSLLPGYGQDHKYLFNLKDDPEERNNLYNSLPHVVSLLEGKMAKQRKRYVDPNFPPNNPKGHANNFGGVWSPGWC